MDRLDVQVGSYWPLLVGVLAALVLGLLWVRREGVPFPDVRLAAESQTFAGLPDLLPVLLGAIVLALFVLSLMNVSLSRQVVVDKRARDFLVLVDTSRSMREGTALQRQDVPPSFSRRAGLFSEVVDDPDTIPELARYEVARESLLDFLESRHPDDRIALIFFNTDIYLMSGFTGNLDFVERQLAGMDDYVNFTTNIRGALEQGLNMIERYPSRNRQAVILLTDAEARNTEDLQLQMDRLTRLDLALYLLWITADPSVEVSEKAREFVDRARAIGRVYTVEDVGGGHLDEAFAEIGELESYAYQEPRMERLDISRYAFDAGRWLMLFWVGLIATVHYPSSAASLAKAAPHRA